VTGGQGDIGHLDSAAQPCLTRGLRFYGLLDRVHAEVIEFYATVKQPISRSRRSSTTSPNGPAGSRSCSWTSQARSRPWPHPD